MRWTGRRSTPAALDRLRRGGTVVVPASRARMAFVLALCVLGAVVSAIVLVAFVQQFVTGDRDERIGILLAPVTWALIATLVGAGVLAPLAIVRRRGRLDALVLTPLTFGEAFERDVRGRDGATGDEVPVHSSTAWDAIIRFRGERLGSKWPLPGKLFIVYDTAPDGSDTKRSAGTAYSASVAMSPRGFMVPGARTLRPGYVGGPAALLDLLRRAHALGVERAGSRPAP